MKSLLALLGLGLFIAAASAQEAKADPSDGERLSGAWVVESVRVNGRDDIPTYHAWVDSSFTVEAGVLRFPYFPGGAGKSNAFKIDPAASPKQLDVELLKAPVDGKKTPGFLRAIYKFDGDRLRVTLGVANEEDRPDSFDHSATGPPFLHVKLRRPGLVGDSLKTVPPVAGQAVKVRALRQERLKALRLAAENAMTRYEADQLRMPELIALDEAVYTAERDLLTDSDDRADLLDRRIRRLKAHEEHLTTLAETGAAPAPDQALMKAARLAAEIERELGRLGK